MMIKNEDFARYHFSEKDILIYSTAYEARSLSIKQKIAGRIPCENILSVVDCALESTPRIAAEQVRLEELGIKSYLLDGKKFKPAQEIIREFVSIHQSERESIAIHFDYSSMPRAWYCGFAVNVKELLREKDEVYFWYSEGEYPATYEEYPRSGTDGWTLFSGAPSLCVPEKRFHVVGLSYDAIRTQAIVFDTDPEHLIACEAYNPLREEVHKNVIEANQAVLAQAAMRISLHIDDFEFMICKLREVAREFQMEGDVIFIPDGPKPLILAMSLVPYLVNQKGISCLHVGQNSDKATMLDVKATGTILGFKIYLLDSNE